jgi:predicted metal-dependent hydrolase
MSMNTDTDKVSLAARDVSWDWTGLPMHYFDSNPFATHYANGMNMLLPEGEVFFVDVFQQALPLIKDDAVREDVIGFIGQEATHSSSPITARVPEFRRARYRSVRHSGSVVLSPFAR